MLDRRSFIGIAAAILTVPAAIFSGSRSRRACAPISAPSGNTNPRTKRYHGRSSTRFDDPNNWGPGGMPVSGDSVVFCAGSTCTHGWTDGLSLDAVRIEPNASVGVDCGGVRFNRLDQFRPSVFVYAG